MSLLLAAGVSGGGGVNMPKVKAAAEIGSIAQQLSFKEQSRIVNVIDLLTDYQKNRYKINKPVKVKGSDEISNIVKRLSISNQSYIFDTINALLYAKEHKIARGGENGMYPPQNQADIFVIFWD